MQYDDPIENNQVLEQEDDDMAIYQDVFKRYEKKYMMDRTQYEAIREALDERMEPDQFGRSTICNIYYDTDQFDLIRASLEKPAYKEKLRLRSYGVPDGDSTVFLELKKKYQGIVYKRRTQMTLREAQEYLEEGRRPREDSQILREIDYFLQYYTLYPKVMIAYDRVALYGKEDPALRVTFDEKIRWRDWDRKSVV